MIAIIPARGGSKGVPNKNIKLLNGRPLIEYTISAAIESQIFEHIVVSTDSQEIAEISKQLGACVPIMRPSNISEDHSSSDDAIVHMILELEKIGIFTESICKLQPTSPLRTSDHIREAYSMFTAKKYKFLVSICECEHSPLWSGTINASGQMDQFMESQYVRKSRQELERYYRLNGAIYMAEKENFMQKKCFIGSDTYSYIMPQENSIDIDSLLDFKIAEYLLIDRRLKCE